MSTMYKSIGLDIFGISFTPYIKWMGVRFKIHKKTSFPFSLSTECRQILGFIHPSTVTTTLIKI